MSSRLYPLYQKGNPQLRIFLPNVFMKLVRPPPHSPSNRLMFIVSNEMSKYDVENYLKKIYNVEIAAVTMRIQQGRFRQANKGYVIKDDDYKVASVILPKGVSFEFPDIYPEEKQKDEQAADDQNTKALREADKGVRQRNKARPDVPSWFTV